MLQATPLNTTIWRVIYLDVDALLTPHTCYCIISLRTNNGNPPLFIVQCSEMYYVQSCLCYTGGSLVGNHLVASDCRLLLAETGYKQGAAQKNRLVIAFGCQYTAAVSHSSDGRCRFVDKHKLSCASSQQTAFFKGGNYYFYTQI